tara:strand:- start:19 stop:609 length:591 start_codon:yes stop_codon:yes gene_type:complete
MSGWVYLIRNGDLHKIGITRNLHQRMRQLKPDEIVSVLETKDFKSLEKSLHKRYKTSRIPQTEYFRLTKSQRIDCKKKLLQDKYKSNCFFQKAINRLFVLIWLFSFATIIFVLSNLIGEKELTFYIFLECLIDSFAWTALFSWLFSVRALLISSRRALTVFEECKDRSERSLIFVILALISTLSLLLLNSLKVFFN